MKYLVTIAGNRIAEFVHLKHAAQFATLHAGSEIICIATGEICWFNR